MRFAGGGVDFVPPAKTDKAPASDVFEVVEVGGEEEERYNEDEDAGRVSLVVETRTMREGRTSCR